MCITLVHKVRASAVSQSPVPPASDVVANRHSTVPPHTVTGECASSLLKLAVTQELVHCVYTCCCMMKLYTSKVKSRLILYIDHSIITGAGALGS